MAARSLKIFFLIRSLHYGGAERQLVTLAKLLKGQGQRVRVGVFYDDGPLGDDLRAAGVEVVNLNKKGRWDLWRFFWWLRGWIAQEKPDVIHSYLVDANLLVAPMRFLARPVRVVWGVRASNMALNRYDWTAKVAFRLTRWASRCPHLIIANSKAGRDFHVRHGYPAKKITVIHNGIDTARFAPNAKLRAAFRKELRVGRQEKLVGLVGRMDPMKDHPAFLNMAARLVKIRPNTRFVCVGGGPARYAQELYNLAHRLGLDEKVAWEGARHDLVPVYNGLDVLVSASSFGEGFPNVVAEAMACGVPCVVTDVGDAGWIVGETGVVTPPGSPAELAKGVAHLLDNPDLFSCQAARERIVIRFGLEALVAHTLSALRGTVEAP